MDFRVRMLAMLVMLPALAACATQSNGPPPPVRVNVASLPAGASAAAQGEDALSRAVLTAINGYRTAHDAPAMTSDPALQRAAAVHSADMSLRNFVGHYNPDGQGPTERVMAVLPTFTGDLAENIAVIDGASGKSPDAIAAELLKLWVASPQHRKNIRNGAYTSSGVGIARKGDTIYATELFAAR